MKRRISKRREKILIARALKYAKELTQFDPQDDFTFYCMRRYMADVQLYYGTRVYLFPRQTVNVGHSTI